MADRLVICCACSRHIKSAETICPFCGEAAGLARTSTGEPFRRMAAAAAVAAGVAALTGCSASGTAFYGSPAPVEGLDAAGDSAADAPSAVAFYGIANPIPADAGDAAMDSAADAPSAVAFYGIANPIPTDAGDAAMDSAADAPSAVAFYGIANPSPIDAAGDLDGPAGAPRGSG
ncbi:MAG: hypothetical protein ABSC94_28160 [Polyangiaceae bacterium]